MENKQLIDNGDEISISDLMGFFWRYRVVFLVSIFVSLMLVMGALICVGMLTPQKKLASLPFRVLFEGASEGSYPNGLKYNPSDIIDGNVLQQVYEKNKLVEYLPFDEFKGSLFISETNNALVLLDKEYQKSLSDKTLSMIDRQTLEAEYKNKRQSVRNQSYALRFLCQTTIFSIPSPLMEKVLKNILATWAQVVDSKKGAFKYRMALYTKNILSNDSLVKEDYIVSIDMLNSKIKHILHNIDQLGLFPGAKVARVGDVRIGLIEIKSNLQDTRKYKLDPLVGLIRKTGLSKKPELALLYLENQLFQLKLNKEQSLNNIDVMQNTLNYYLEKNKKESVASSDSLTHSKSGNSGQLSTNYIPQFGDSFLDRIVEMSTQGNDVKYRQDITSRIMDEGIKVSEMNKTSLYYQSLVTAMQNKQSGDSKNISEIVVFIKERFLEIQRDILLAFEQVEAVYNSISNNNLRPQAELYIISDPFLITDEGSFFNKNTSLMGVLFVMLSLSLTVMGCFINDHYKRRKE